MINNHYLIETLGVQLNCRDLWIDRIFNNIEKCCDNFVSSLSSTEIKKSISDSEKKYTRSLFIKNINEWIDELKLVITIKLFNSNNFSKYGAINAAENLYNSEGRLGCFDSDKAIISNNKFKLCEIELNVVYDVHTHRIFYEGQTYYKSSLVHELMHAYSFLLEENLHRKTFKKMNAWIGETITDLQEINPTIADIFYFINDYDQVAIINEEHARFIKFCDTLDITNALYASNNTISKETILLNTINAYLKKETAESGESHLWYINNLILYLKNEDNIKHVKTAFSYFLKEISAVLHVKITKKNLDELPGILISKLETLKRKIIRMFFQYYDFIENYKESRKQDKKLMESLHIYPRRYARRFDCF